VLLRQVGERYSTLSNYSVSITQTQTEVVLPVRIEVHAADGGKFRIRFMFTD